MSLGERMAVCRDSKYTSAMVQPPQQKTFKPALRVPSSDAGITAWKCYCGGSSSTQNSKSPSGFRGGFRHVQHLRPNRGPHKKGAPTI